MAINPISSGAFAPSSSPAALLSFFCSIVFRQPEGAVICNYRPLSPQCRWRDLNLHARSEHYSLNPVSLPIPPLAHFVSVMIAFPNALSRQLFCLALYDRKQLKAQSKNLIGLPDVSLFHCDNNLLILAAPGMTAFTARPVFIAFPPQIRCR